MAYVGFNPQNVPVPPYYVNPPVPPCPPGPPMPPGPTIPPGPHGKFPNDGFLINYEGLATDTAEVVINNQNRTIAVNVNKEGADQHFVYATPVPMASWEIDHNLNKYPSVTLTDWDGNVIGGDIKYINTNKVIVNLSEPICGRAYLN